VFVGDDQVGAGVPTAPLAVAWSSPLLILRASKSDSISRAAPKCASNWEGSSVGQIDLDVAVAVTTCMLPSLFMRISTGAVFRFPAHIAADAAQPTSWSGSGAEGAAEVIGPHVAGVHVEVP